MRTVSNLLAATAIAAGALLASAPAQAATIFNIPVGSGLTGGSTAAIAKTSAVGLNTYNFTFSTAAPLKLVASLSAGFWINFTPAYVTSFTLFQGTPGSGVSLGSATAGLTPSLTAILPTAGNYYIQLGPVTGHDEAVQGTLSFTSLVPEPAAWTFMITGFGLLGLAARRRRQTATTAA